MAITTQSSVVTLTSDDQNVTITGVDLAHTFLIVDASSNSASSKGFQDWGVTGILTDSTTVRLRRDGSTVDAEVVVQAVSCDQGEFVVTSRGTARISASDATESVTVEETDLGRTLLMYNSRGNFGTSDTRYGFVTGKHTSSTGLEFERGGSPTGVTNIAYEVVEWSLESGVRVAASVLDCSGLTGTTDIDEAHGVSGVTYDGTTKLSNSWLFAQSRHESNGLEQCAVRVYFDTSKVYASRYNTTVTAYDSHVAWQLVTFPEDCCEHRTPAMASGDTTKDNIMELVMDTGATIVWQTNSCDGTGTAFGRNAWNAQVLNSTTVRQGRTYTGQPCEAAISVCDFSLLTENSYPILFAGQT